MPPKKSKKEIVRETTHSNSKEINNFRKNRRYWALSAIWGQQ